MGLSWNDVAQITCTGSAVLLSSSQLNVEAVTFHAPSTNSNPVYIGSSSVSSSRFILKLLPGETRNMAGPMSAQGDDAFIPLGSLYQLGTNGEKLNYGYCQRS